MKNSVLAAALIGTLLLTGCGKDFEIVVENEEITPISFSWWGTDTRHEYTLEGIQTFEENHPNIDVTCNYAEWTGFKNRIDLESASHTLSDVLQINYSWLADYSPDGDYFYDLNELRDEIDLSNYTEEEIAYGTINGKLNALPIAMNSQIFYYNKTLYDTYKMQIPVCWEDLFTAAKAMKADGIYPMSGEFQHIFYMLTSYTEQQIGKKAPFTEEDYEVFLKFYRRLVDEKVIPRIEDYEKTKIQDRIYAGNLCWISDADKNFQELIDEGQIIVIGDFLTMPEGVKRSGWYYKPATMYAISGETEHPKEAGELLNYLINSPQMSSLQGIEKGVPVSKAAYENISEDGTLSGIQFEAYQKMKENQDGMELSDPQMEDSNRIAAYKSICDQYLYDQISLKTAAAEMVKYNVEKTK